MNISAGKNLIAHTPLLSVLHVFQLIFFLIRRHFKAGDLGPRQRLACLPHRIGTGLRLHLSTTDRYLAVKSPIDIGVTFTGVIVILPSRVRVTVKRIKPAHLSSIRFFQTINRISIQGISQRQVRPQSFGQMPGCYVVMIIVRPPAMPPILVEFPRQKGVGSSIVLDRVKNRNPVCRYGNSPPEKVRLGGHPNFCRDWIERDRPSISQIIRLGKRHLLLPSRDANHHRMIWKTIRTHVEVFLIPIYKHSLRKLQKGVGCFRSRTRLGR